MGHTRPHRERRNNHRVELDGTALLFQRGDPVGQYRLENISAGGALVTGRRELQPGHLVHVLMHLSPGDEPMSMTGAVRRSQRVVADPDGLAISFPALSADQEDAIHDAVLRALVRNDARVDRAPILVFEPRARVRAEIEAELRSFGMPFVSVASLADAINELEAEETEYVGLLIHSATHDPEALDAVEFFARADGLLTIVLPEPGGQLPSSAQRLVSLPRVRVPRIWSRAALRQLLWN